jgi:hypothetical protein
VMVSMIRLRRRAITVAWWFAETAAAARRSDRLSGHPLAGLSGLLRTKAVGLVAGLAGLGLHVL